MATRSHNRLSDRAIKALIRPGKHADGGGLYLEVKKSGSRSWAFIWTRNGTQEYAGLGAYPILTAAEAREKARECRKIVANGGDPQLTLTKQAEPSFAEAVELFLADNRTAWKNDKHKAQWVMTLGDTYCRALGPMRVSMVGTEDVLRVLKPIWIPKSETASRLRGRIERVLSFAKVKGWRSGENPAQWRNHLDAILPKRRKLSARGHHAAMPYSKVPAFAQRLRSAEAMAARALEFLILTAARSGEVLNARWEEIDLEQAIWTIPAERMKAGRQHQVPLSPRAVEILAELANARRNDFVFPGQRSGRPLSASSMEMLLRRLKAKAITVHGFRSSFRDWTGDCTDFPREIAEAALAHTIQGVEGAYRRGSALDKRRKLMTAWANFITQAGDTVVPLHAIRQEASG